MADTTTGNPSLGSFWADHGTKVLGYTISILSLLASGSVALPPPLNAHSTAIIAWAVFLNIVLGALVTGRGYANTSAIASKVVEKQAEATPVPPVVVVAPATAPVVPAAAHQSISADQTQAIAEALYLHMAQAQQRSRAAAVPGPAVGRVINVPPSGVTK